MFIKCECFKKLFTVEIHECSQSAKVLVRGRSLHPSVIFASKAGAYPRVDHFLASPTRLEWHKFMLILIMLKTCVLDTLDGVLFCCFVTRDKHSSLLRPLINYGPERFYNIGPWKFVRLELEIEGITFQDPEQFYKTFYGCNLWLFIVN